MTRKLKMRTTLAGPAQTVRAGQTALFDDEQAADLIAGGYADDLGEVVDEVAPAADVEHSAASLKRLKKPGLIAVAKGIVAPVDLKLDAEDDTDLTIAQLTELILDAQEQRTAAAGETAEESEGETAEAQGGETAEESEGETSDDSETDEEWQARTGQSPEDDESEIAEPRERVEA